MQAHLVHQAVHDERGACHVARILHKRDEKVQNENLRNEYRHASHTSDYSVHHKVLEGPVGQYTRCQASHPSEQALYPLLWVCSKQEHRAEHRPHNKQEYWESQPTACHKAVNAACLLLRVLVAGLECLLQRTVDEAVLGTAYGSLHINANLCLHSLCVFLGNMLPAWQLHYLAQEIRNLLVALEQFQCPIAYRELLRQVVGLVQFGRQRGKFLLNDVTVVYMNVSYGLVVTLEQFYDGIQQFVQSHAVLCNGWNHGYTHHRTQVLIVELCAGSQQFVIHVQRYYCAQVHVNELGGEVKVALYVRCHNCVDDHVGNLLEQVLAHVNLLGRVCRNGVCSRQVGEVYTVTLVVEVSAFGTHCDTAVVAHVLVLVGK